MVEEAGEEIEVSGDAIALAEAIGYCGDGFHAIARAIEKLAASMNGDECDPEESETYLDGTRK